MKIFITAAALMFSMFCSAQKNTQNPTFKKVTGRWFMAGAPEKFIDLKTDSSFIESAPKDILETRAEDASGARNVSAVISPAPRFNVTGNRITVTYADGSKMMYEYYYDLKLREWGIKGDADGGGIAPYYFKHKYP